MRIGKTLAGLCLMASILAPPAAGAEELFLSVDFQPPVHSRSPLGDVLTVPGADLTGHPGEPRLPRKTFYVMLPSGHQAVNVRPEALVVEPLDGTYEIMPAQQPVPLSRMHLARPTPPDPAVYESEAAFPGRWMETGSIQFKHGYAVLPVNVHPLSYHPKSGLVNRIASVTLVVETSPGGEFSPRFRADPADTDRVMRLCDLVTPVHSYRRTVARGPSQLPPGDYQYVIITPEMFLGLADPGSLESLRDARIAGGLTARIETLEWIQANFDGSRPDGGQDDATRVRDFLQAAHDEWGTQYVLLVGDADAGDVGGESGDDLLPVRKLYVDPGGEVSPDHIPADLYYSCLDGSYDYDSDGAYGEQNDGPGGGEVDLLSELSVGRAPADSGKELQNFVTKTLAYENGAGNWLKDVWMVGEWLFDNPTYWAADDLDQLIYGAGAGADQTLGFSSFPFFECHTLYDKPVRNSWGPEELIPILNDSPHIVNHLGHSNVYYNMRMQTQDVDDLLNLHPFLQYSQGCLNGSFDNRAEADSGGYVYAQDCISEHLVMGEHGAFAAIVNSRYGLGYGYSHQFNRWFWHAFFSEEMATVGEAFAYCKDENASLFNNTGYRWAGYTVNLLGDPASALKKSINTTDPILGVYPPGLTFFYILGDDDPDPQNMCILNDGVGDISFTAVADQPWITVSSSSGPAPADLEVSVDPSSLAPGEHAGVITVSSDEAPNSPVQMPVELLVVEIPRITIPHTRQAPELDGQLTSGEYDEALALPIGIDMPAHVMLYMVVSGNELFLAIEDLSDTSPGSWDAFYLLFDRDMDGQWPSSPGNDGEYILAASFGGFTVYIPNINRGNGRERYGRGYLESPPGWRGKSGFQDGHRVWEAALDTEVSRVDVGPEGVFGALIYSVNTADENTRYVTGLWPPVIPETDDQRYFGEVNLCPEGPRLDSTPVRLDYDVTLGETTPETTALSLFDREGGNIAYTARSSADWIQVAPSTGQTPDNLVVTVDPAGLQIGNYSEAVIIESGDAWNSPYEIPVTLQVWGEPARLAVEPTEFNITAVEDGPDPQAEFKIFNLGGRPMDVFLTPSEPWMKLSLDSDGMGPAPSQREVTITADLSQLGPGSHSGEITIRGVIADDSPQVLSVQLEVVEPRPVPPAENLELGILDSALQLNWTRPDDPLVSGVLVRFQKGVPPDSPQSGEFVYDGMDEQATHEELTNGTAYCYSAFAHDSAGRYAGPATACGVPGSNRKPPMPGLLSPAPGAVVPATPELVASTVQDPDGDVVAYTFVLLDSSETLDSEVMSGTGNRVSWIPNTQLQPEIPYRWQVEAVDEKGVHSGFAETRTFTIRPTTDGGTDGGPPGDGDGGCDCGHPPGGSAGLLALVFLAMLRRRTFREY